MRTHEATPRLGAAFEQQLAIGGGTALARAAGLPVAGEVTVQRITRRAGRWTAADLVVPQPAGRPVTLVVLATAGELPGGVCHLDVDAMPADAGWRRLDGLHLGAFPLAADPRLPGLAVASSRVRLSRLLGARVTRIERRRYRHLQRAVLRAELADGRAVWVKVLRPPRAAQLADVHREVGRVVRAPAVVARDDPHGIVALEHLEGLELRGMARSRAAPDPTLWPSPDALLDLNGRLARLEATRPSPRQAPLAAVDRHAASLRRVLPEAADRVDRLAAELRLAPAPPAVATTTIHGDLHAAQLVCTHGGAGGRVGLLDLDDVGGGDPLDDRCRLVGHLVGTIETTPTPHGRVLLRALVDRVVTTGGDPARLRVTAVLLGQALGPHRASRSGWRPHALHRLRTAERWAAGETSLRPL